MNELENVIHNDKIKILIKNAIKQFFALLEESDDGMTLVDEMGHLELFNSAMEKLTGYSQTEAKMFFDFNLFMYPDPIFRKQALRELNNLSNPGDTYKMETTFTTKDNRQKSVLVSTKLINLNKRRLFLNTYYSITEHNPLKVQFRKNTNDTRNDPRIFKKNEQKVINKDLNHQDHIDQANLEKKHLIDQQSEFPSPHLVQEMNIRLQNAIDSKELEMHQGILQRLDTIKEDLVIQYINLFDFAPIGYFVLDCDATIQQANFSGKCLLGLSNTWLVDKQFTLFVSQDFRFAFNEFLDQVFTHKNTITCETMLLRNSNLPFWVHMKAKTIKEGKKCYLVVMDIDERKKTEMELIKQLNLFYAIHLITRVAMNQGTIQNIVRTFLTIAEVLTISKFGFVGQFNKHGLFDVISFSNPEWDDSFKPELKNVKIFQNLELNGVWGRTLRKQTSEIVNNTRFEFDEMGFLEGFPLISSYLGVPLMYNGRIIGLIALANKQGEYTTDDQRAIEILSRIFIEVVFRKLT